MKVRTGEFEQYRLVSGGDSDVAATGHGCVFSNYINTQQRHIIYPTINH